MYDNRPGYNYALKAFEEHVQLASAVSGSIHHQPVDDRSFWASVLFAKLCVTSVSLAQLLPGNRIFPSAFNNWDTPSVATLARNVIENYHAYFYLCIEKVPDTEWQCRLQLFNLHDFLTRKKILTDFQVIGEDLPKFEQQADELRTVLKQNNFFLTLSENEQKRLLKGESAFYLTREAIQQRVGIGESDLKAMYRLTLCPDPYLTYVFLPHHRTAPGYWRRNGNRTALYLHGCRIYYSLFAASHPPDPCTLPRCPYKVK